MSKWNKKIRMMNDLVKLIVLMYKLFYFFSQIN